MLQKNQIFGDLLGWRCRRKLKNGTRNKLVLIFKKNQILLKNIEYKLSISSCLHKKSIQFRVCHKGNVKNISFFNVH